MGNNIKTVARTEQLKQRCPASDRPTFTVCYPILILMLITGREKDAMDQIRYLRNKEKRHAEKMERVQNEELHQQILGTLEDDFNHNFVDPLKDWTGEKIVMFVTHAC